MEKAKHGFQELVLIENFHTECEMQ
jgi:hypothetical protein